MIRLVTLSLNSRFTLAELNEMSEEIGIPELIKKVESVEGKTETLKHLLRIKEIEGMLGHPPNGMTSIPDDLFKTEV